MWRQRTGDRSSVPATGRTPPTNRAIRPTWGTFPSGADGPTEAANRWSRRCQRAPDHRTGVHPDRGAIEWVRGAAYVVPAFETRRPATIREPPGASTTDRLAGRPDHRGRLVARGFRAPITSRVTGHHRPPGPDGRWAAALIRRYAPPASPCRGCDRVRRLAPRTLPFPPLPSRPGLINTWITLRAAARESHSDMPPGAAHCPRAASSWSTGGSRGGARRRLPPGPPPRGPPRTIPGRTRPRERLPGAYRKGLDCQPGRGGRCARRTPRRSSSATMTRAASATSGSRVIVPASQSM